MPDVRLERAKTYRKLDTRTETRVGTGKLVYIYTCLLSTIDRPI